MRKHHVGASLSFTEFSEVSPQPAVTCPNGGNCNDPATCCPMIGEWSCCPLAGATCCANTTFCCPEGSDCCMTENMDGACCESPYGICCEEGCCPDVATICCGEFCCVEGQSTCDPDNGCVPICNLPCINGQCTNFNQCSCDSGWSGFECNIPVCSPSCGNQAQCVAPNTCSCNAGFGNPPSCNVVEPVVLFGTVITLQNVESQNYLVADSTDSGVNASGTNPYESNEEFMIFLANDLSYRGPWGFGDTVVLQSVANNNFLSAGSSGQLCTNGNDSTDPSQQFFLALGPVNTGNNVVLTSILTSGVMGSPDGSSVNVNPGNPEDSTGQWFLVGLEQSYLISQVHNAAIDAINGQTELALQLLNEACLVNSTYFEYIERNLTDPYIPEVASGACTQATNIANGLSVFGYAQNWVFPLEWTDYQQIVSALIGELTTSDSWIQTYMAEGTTDQAKLSLAQEALASNQGDLQYWSGKVQQDQQLLAAYAGEIIVVRQEIANTFGNIKQAYDSFVNDVNNTIAQLNEEISSIESEEEAQEWLGIFSDLGKMFIGGAEMACGDEEGVGDFFSGTMGILGDVLQSGQENPQIAQLESEINTLENLLSFGQTLLAMASNLEKLDQYIYNTSKPLPAQIPTLYQDQLEISELQNYLGSFQATLIQYGGQVLDYDVQDFISLVQMHLNLVFSWYQTAMTTQNDQAQLNVYQLRSQLVQQEINSDYGQLNGINQAENLLYEKRSNQVYLFMLYFYQEVKQFQYFALQYYPVSIPQNPTTADLEQAQTNLQVAINEALSERNTGPTQCWARFYVSSQNYSSQFQSLYQNNTMAISIMLPNVTNYYMVYYTNVHVYFVSSNKASNQIVQVQLVHQGQSFFLDQYGTEWNFTHTCLDYTFYYNSTTNCPTSQPFNSPDYINYSPFGRWIVTLPQNSPIDVQSVDEVIFEFELYFYEHQTPQTEPLFGNDPYWQSDTCVGPYASNCPNDNLDLNQHNILSSF